MTVALLMLIFVLGALIGLYAFGFYAAQDQVRGLLAERDAAYADVARLHRILDARLDDTPLASEVARYLTLVDGDELDLGPAS